MDLWSWFVIPAHNFCHVRSVKIEQSKISGDPAIPYFHVLPFPGVPLRGASKEINSPSKG